MSIVSRAIAACRSGSRNSIVCMLCSRSAILTMTTRTSSAIATSILRSVSASSALLRARSATSAEGRCSIFVAPSTRLVTSAPKRWVSSRVLMPQSSITSCSNAAWIVCTSMRSPAT